MRVTSALVTGLAAFSSLAMTAPVDGLNILERTPEPQRVGQAYNGGYGAPNAEHERRAPEPQRIGMAYNGGYDKAPNAEHERRAPEPQRIGMAYNGGYDKAPNVEHERRDADSPHGEHHVRM